MSRLRRLFPLRLAVLLALPLVLAACDKNKEEILEGTRIPVFAEARVDLSDLLAERGADEGGLKLPAPVAPDFGWPQQSGSANHAPGRLRLATLDALEPVWNASYGSSRVRAPLPAVADGRVFAYNGDAGVSAFALENGARLWNLTLDRERESGAFFGGGVAVVDKRLFVSTGFGLVYALSVEDGTELWRTQTGEPIRGAPTAGGGRVFITTLSNRTIALGEADGAVVWTHAGSPQQVFVAYSASSALQGSSLLVPHSTGEFVALVAETGFELWVESGSGGVDASLRSPAVPALDSGQAVVLGPGGLVAIDIASGSVQWETEFPGVEAPWLAGTHAFLVGEGSLVALSRAEGGVRWSQVLAREPAKGTATAVVWFAPRLVEQGVLVLSAEGELAVFDPDTGVEVARRDFKRAAAAAPVIAEGTLLYVSPQGGLVALR